MNRDMDLVRNILRELSKTDEPLDASRFASEQYPLRVVCRHIEWMRDAGLIVAEVFRQNGRYTYAAAVDLTWSGCDFLDAVRSESVWATVKRKVATAVGSASIDTLKAVAGKVALDQLSSI